MIRRALEALPGAAHLYIVEDRVDGVAIAGRVREPAKHKRNGRGRRRLGDAEGAQRGGGARIVRALGGADQRKIGVAVAQKASAYR